MRPTGTGPDQSQNWQPDAGCAVTVLIFEVIVFGLAIPVVILVSEGAPRRRRRICRWRGGAPPPQPLHLRSQVGYVLGWVVQRVAPLSDS